MAADDKVFTDIQYEINIENLQVLMKYFEIYKYFFKLY